jgi:integrase
MTLYLRGKIWGMKRRVPVRYAAVEPRKVIWVSLKTDSLTIARTKAENVWQRLLDAWEARLAGQDEDAARRYAAAMDLAAQRGFQFLSADKVAALPTVDLVARLSAVMAQPEQTQVTEARALLGGTEEVYPRLSDALESYWSLAASSLRRKSDDQRRRWENPRKKAIKNLIGVIGDKRLDKITPDDMQDFHDWWLERLEKENLTANSANKDINNVGVILKLVNDRKKYRLDLPLSGYRFSEDEKTARPPFTDKWIREKLLAPGALDGLNPDAKAILLGMINTGYRPSEGAALRSEHIILDGDVPKIQIAPDERREIKTKSSKRYIPLTGVSLDIFRAYPHGFARYKDSAASLSATVNKYLRANGLMESEKHVMYSLRHAFEDRMLRAGFDERIRRDLMGHALDRERYGDGGGEEHKFKLLQDIAIV